MSILGWCDTSHQWDTTCIETCHAVYFIFTGLKSSLKTNPWLKRSLHLKKWLNFVEGRGQIYPVSWNVLRSQNITQTAQFRWGGCKLDFSRQLKELHVFKVDKSNDYNMHAILHSCAVTICVLLLLQKRQGGHFSAEWGNEKPNSPLV